MKVEGKLFIWEEEGDLQEGVHQGSSQGENEQSA